MARQNVTTRAGHLEGAIRGLVKLAGGRVTAREETAWCFCTDHTHSQGHGVLEVRREAGKVSHPVTRRELVVVTPWRAPYEDPS